MLAPTFKNSGLRIGSVKGIDVWLHWSLLIWILYDLHGLWVMEKIGGGDALKVWSCLTVGLFGIILLHEFGHCYAAYRMGGGADKVVLWPLGGLAYCDAPNLPRSQFWVATGGPLVNVAIGFVLFVTDYALYLSTGHFHFIPSSVVQFPRSMHDLMIFALNELFYLNTVLLLFNLIPIYPLDGGRIFQCIAWQRTGSYGHATLLTVWVTYGGIALVAILSFFPPLKDRVGWMVVFILLFCFYHTQRLRVSLHEQEEDYAFGYDFSRGYTSLDRTVQATDAKPKEPGLLARMRARREEKRRDYLRELRAKVDVLLDKISNEGMPSLSAGERRFLESASKKLREE